MFLYKWQFVGQYIYMVFQSIQYEAIFKNHDRLKPNITFFVIIGAKLATDFVSPNYYFIYQQKILYFKFQCINLVYIL